MLKQCGACNLPETYETIEFDGKGVCNICRQKEFKDTKIDWSARMKQLVELVEQYRGKYAYDCIVPLLGWQRQHLYFALFNERIQT